MSRYCGRTEQGTLKVDSGCVFFNYRVRYCPQLTRGFSEPQTCIRTENKYLLFSPKKLQVFLLEIINLIKMVPKAKWALYWAVHTFLLNSWAGLFRIRRLQSLNPDTSSCGNAVPGAASWGNGIYKSDVLKERSRFCSKNDVAIFLLHGDFKENSAFWLCPFRKPTT